MTKLLMKLFIPKGLPATDSKVRNAAGKLSGWVGIGANLLLFGAKFILGLLSGSVSVTADAMNNLTDASSAIVTLIGFKLAEKPADEDHPYGHARFEYLSGLAVAALVIVIGFELGKSSVGKIFAPTSVTVTPLLFAILIGSMAVKLWLSLFNTRLGKYIDSSALLATAADSRNDVIATGAVLLAALIEKISGWQVDGYMGLAVAAFILYSGVMLARETISPLLGEAASPELQKEIIGILEKEEAVLGYHDLMVHDYGPGQRFGSLHVEMSQQLDPLFCHERIDDLERECLHQLGVHLVIHYDPIVVGDPEMDERKALVEKTLKEIDSRLRFHDFRMVRGQGHSNLIFDIVLPQDLQKEQKNIKNALENALTAHYQGRTYLVITFDVENFNLY